MGSLGRAIWPVDILGYPQADGYRFSSQPAFDAYRQSDGPTRFAYPRRNAPMEFSLTFIMDLQQFIYFEGFVYHNLNQGNRWFVMPLVAGNLPIASERRDGTELFDVHLTGPYTANLQGLIGHQMSGDHPREAVWEVGFDLEATFSSLRSNYPSDLVSLVKAGTIDDPAAAEDRIMAGTPSSPSPEEDRIQAPQAPVS